MLQQVGKGLIKKLSSLIIPTIVSSAVLSSPALAEDRASDNYIYGGLELGLSEPIWKEFDYKDDQNRKTRIRLKDSEMIGGRVGWSFYPNMAIEISGTHQPEHAIAYTLPEVQVASIPGLTISKTSGRTKVKANVYTLNLIYRLPSLEFATITPYIIGGAGVAIINVRPTSSDAKIPAPFNLALGMDKTEYFRVKKTKTNSPVYQAGIGFVKEFGKNFEIDISSKFQIVQNIKINYETLNLTNSKFEKQKPIKKTIAVGEFALGLLFKLPV